MRRNLLSIDPSCATPELCILISRDRTQRTWLHKPLVSNVLWSYVEDKLSVEVDNDRHRRIKPRSLTFAMHPLEAHQRNRQLLNPVKHNNPSISEQSHTFPAHSHTPLSPTIQNTLSPQPTPQQHPNPSSQPFYSETRLPRPMPNASAH